MVKNEDKISIQFMNHEYFVSIMDEFTLAPNYTVLSSVLTPLQASEEDTIIVK